MKPVTYREAPAREGADPAHLIVYLEGAQQKSRWRPGPIIREVLTGYGKLDVVDYPDGPFRSQRVINTLADHIQRRLRSGYERVTFICVSMSGLLAHDIIKELILRRYMLKNPSILLLDAPSGGVDLVDKRAHLARYIPQIWTPKPLNRLVLGNDTLPSTRSSPARNRSESGETMSKPATPSPSSI